MKKGMESVTEKDVDTYIQFKNWEGRTEMTDTREMITADPRGDTMDIGDGEMRTTQSDTTMIIGGETDTLDIVEII